MDYIVSTLKSKLNEMEDKYENQSGPNLETNIMNFFKK